MNSLHWRSLPWFASLALLAACAADTREVPSGVESGIDAHAFFADRSPWSEPVNLGPPINTAGTDFNATLSSDELSLYFASDRPGGVGGIDIWVSQRACLVCPWGTPLNLGPVINSLANDNAPSLSLDGHLLFFSSTRPGGAGGNDIYLSRRADPTDDFGWAAPVNLGPNVNTVASEAGPEYLQSAEDGPANLYFNRRVTGGSADIYSASLTRDGEALAPAVPVAELNDPAADDQAATVRTDGREVLFLSDRAGTLGMSDLWVSTRRSVHDPWSTPVNLGPPLNTASNDQQPSLSSDARTLIFTSNRPGGLGGFDIWIATRTPSGR